MAALRLELVLVRPVDEDVKEVVDPSVVVAVPEVEDVTDCTITDEEDPERVCVALVAPVEVEYTVVVVLAVTATLVTVPVVVAALLVLAAACASELTVALVPVVAGSYELLAEVAIVSWDWTELAPFMVLLGVAAPLEGAKLEERYKPRKAVLKRAKPISPTKSIVDRKGESTRKC